MMPRLREFQSGYSARRRRESLTDLISEGIQAGEFPADIDPELAARRCSARCSTAG